MHTHITMSNSPEKPKSLLSLYWQKPEVKDKEACTRWVLSLLNAHSRESGHPQRYALKNGSLVVGTANN